jgi:hypothetical protein
LNSRMCNREQTTQAFTWRDEKTLPLSTLKMEATCFSESLGFFRTAQRYNSEDRTLRDRDLNWVFQNTQQEFDALNTFSYDLIRIRTHSVIILYFILPFRGNGMLDNVLGQE